MNVRPFVSSLLIHALGVWFVSLGMVAGLATQATAQVSNAPSLQDNASKQAWGHLEALGVKIEPGTKHKLTSMPMTDFVGLRMAVPVWIARGQKPGKTLAVTAGIHGDELNGVEIARRIFVEVDPKQLSGNLIVIPVFNRHGFLSGNRYMSDRRDLNRAFPGNPRGSSADITAQSVFEPAILKSDALVDLHTASDTRINLPQIRTDLSSPAALDLARNFGTCIVLNGKGPTGSLRRSTLDAGIPAIIYEAGGVLVLQPDEIERGVTGVRNIMNYMGMLPAETQEAPQATVYKKTRWLRVPPGAAGMFLTRHKPGDEVKQGEVLGEVVDPFSDKSSQIVASDDGLIIGMEVPNIVYTGDALFHIGLEKMQQ